jgi:hypothetical protein
MLAIGFDKTKFKGEKWAGLAYLLTGIIWLLITGRIFYLGHSGLAEASSPITLTLLILGMNKLLGNDKHPTYNKKMPSVTIIIGLTLVVVALLVAMGLIK